MTKTKKMNPLEVGQRVWIESTPMFYQGERSLSEYEIVEVNKSSAYAIHVKDLGKEAPYRRRIDLKTRKIKETVSIGYAYVFWETKEAFEDDIKQKQEYASMMAEAIEKVKNMSFDELKHFLGKEI